MQSLLPLFLLFGSGCHDQRHGFPHQDGGGFDRSYFFQGLNHTLDNLFSMFWVGSFASSEGAGHL